MRGLGIPLFVAVVFGLGIGGSAQTVSFRSGTDLVRVYATVRDRHGHLVTDLTRDDFQIRDRGTPAAILLFSTDVQPLSVVLVIDKTQGYDAPVESMLRRALGAFVEQLGPNDQATVLSFYAGDIDEALPLTSDHAVLGRRLDMAVRSGLHGIWPGWWKRPLWNAMAEALKPLKTASGRHVLVTLANGGNMALVPGRPGLSEIRTAIADDELMVYGIESFNPVAALNERMTGHAPGDGQPTLRELTQVSGGGHVEAPLEEYVAGRTREGRMSADVVSLMSGIVDELRQQYTIGFVPTQRDGRITNVETRVTRSDMKVCAWKTYRAPAN